MSETQQKLLGHVHDAVIPVRRRDSDFVGFIVSETDEKLFFESSDLRCRRPVAPQQLKNKVVAFDAVDQDEHDMRKAVNIDLLSGAAE